jgi:hypothetical protein
MEKPEFQLQMEAFLKQIAKLNFITCFCCDYPISRRHHPLSGVVIVRDGYDGVVAGICTYCFESPDIEEKVLKQAKEKLNLDGLEPMNEAGTA